MLVESGDLIAGMIRVQRMLIEDGRDERGLMGEREMMTKLCTRLCSLPTRSVLLRGDAGSQGAKVSSQAFGKLVSLLPILGWVDGLTCDMHVELEM